MHLGKQWLDAWECNPKQIDILVIQDFFAVLQEKKSWQLFTAQWGHYLGQDLVNRLSHHINGKTDTTNNQNTYTAEYSSNIVDKISDGLKKRSSIKPTDPTKTEAKKRKKEAKKEFLSSLKNLHNPSVDTPQANIYEMADYIETLLRKKNLSSTDLDAVAQYVITHHSLAKKHWKRLVYLFHPDYSYSIKEITESQKKQWADVFLWLQNIKKS
jgi:hypothetical protein